MRIYLVNLTNIGSEGLFIGEHNYDQSQFIGRQGKSVSPS